MYITRNEGSEIAILLVQVTQDKIQCSHIKLGDSKISVFRGVFRNVAYSND